MEESTLETTQPLETNPRRLFSRVGRWTLIFLAGFLALTIFIFLAAGYIFAQRVAVAANAPLSELIATAQTARLQQPLQTNNQKYFLLLGLDRVANRQGDPLLTDTIVIGSINLKTGQIAMVSLPRDIWIEDYQTRINALYFYGQERNVEQPYQFPTEVISDLIDLPIHHTIVVELNQLADLIDLLGGIDVEITEGFTDTQFPRADVDITSTDPNVLYETVTFETGTEHMSGERALKYIRSRKAEGDQGTDIARGMRQQQVIAALMNKLATPKTALSPRLLGGLYKFYQANFNQYWELTDLLATAWQLKDHLRTFSIEFRQPSIAEDNQPGVIYHPPVTQYGGQWVYAILDREAFTAEIHNFLTNQPTPQP